MDIRAKNINNAVVSYFLPLALLTISVSSFAKEISIYRWVDKNNVVHFSQNLPKNDEYTQLSTISSFKALSKAERHALREKEENEQRLLEQEEQKQQANAANKATFEKNCKAAQLNIKMLNSLDDVLITEEDDKGNLVNRSLSADEKSEKLKLSKKHVELYCNN